MRIERINDKQIRCTLNEKDLKDREIGISELTYGTAKAKALFRDMIQQASYEFGFETDDIPLMIEAIPMLPEALILVITKIEDPDELDTRFSTFTNDTSTSDDDEIIYDDVQYLSDSDMVDYPDYVEEDNDEAEVSSEDDFSENVTNWIPDDANNSEFKNQASDSKTIDNTDFISLPEILGMEPKPANEQNEKNEKKYDCVMIFSFDNLDQIIALASQIHLLYHGQNTLYKEDGTGKYYLLMHRSEHTADEFSKICNRIYEYGSIIRNGNMRQYYFEEHFEAIIADNAIEILAKL